MIEPKIDKAMLAIYKEWIRRHGPLLFTPEQEEKIRTRIRVIDRRAKELGARVPGISEQLEGVGEDLDRADLRPIIMIIDLTDRTCRATIPGWAAGPIGILIQEILETAGVRKPTPKN